MFINLTCRKPNGDFYITSSEVIQDLYPELSDTAVQRYLMSRAQEYLAQGFNVSLTQEELDI